jgi:hypothetical protein
MTATTVSPRKTTPRPRPGTGAGSGEPRVDARMIDPRGHRFGAALSVIILGFGFVASLAIVVALLAVALGISALFGTRYSILGRPWGTVRRTLRIGPPVELEHEFPPRFAQALGALGFAVSALLFALGFATVGWIVAGAVGALQAGLAATGDCLGCRLYFLKWWLPAQFQRLARRTTVA